MEQYMKRLLLLALLLGAAIPMIEAQCWLSEDYLNVKAYKGQRIILGAEPSDPSVVGRTVCYKWADTPYRIEGASLNQPTLPIQAPNQVGEYYFHVKRISDHVVSCSIKVTVTDSIIIESVKPKNGCVEKPLVGCPSIDKFEVVTSPKGYENYVNVTNCERINNTTTTTNDEDYQVTFALIKDGVTMDTKTIPVTYFVNASLGITVSLSDGVVSVSGSLDDYSVEAKFDGDKIKNSFTMLKNIIKRTGTGLKTLAEMTPGLSVTPMSSCFEPEMGGSVAVAVARECCNGKRGIGVDITLSDVGIDYTCGVEVGIGFAKCRVGGELGFHIRSGATTTIKLTCDKDEKPYEFAMGGSIGIIGGLFLEALNADLVRGDAIVEGTATFNAFRLAIHSDATISVRALEICFDISARASLKLMSFIEISTPKIQIVDQKCWAPIKIN